MWYLNLVCKVFLYLSSIVNLFLFFSKTVLFLMLNRLAAARELGIGCGLKRANQNVLTSILDRFRGGISAARAHRRFDGKLHTRHVNTMMRVWMLLL